MPQTTLKRADYEVFCTNLFHLALNYGLDNAARMLKIPEARARKIASRRKWGMQALSPALRNPTLQRSQDVTRTVEIAKAALQHYGNRAQIGLAIAGTTAAEHLSTKNGGQLTGPATAIAADQWSRALDRVHGWSAARQQAPAVAVQVNLTLPTEAEIEERRARHARLDAISKSLEV